MRRNGYYIRKLGGGVEGGGLHTDRFESKQVHVNPAFQVQNSTGKGKF